VRGRGGEQVAAGALFVSWVEGEEVLEQPRRCLAYRAAVSMRGGGGSQTLYRAPWCCGCVCVWMDMDSMCDVCKAVGEAEYRSRH